MLDIIGKVLYHMRKLFLAAPVVWIAVRLYAYAMTELPETVGILLQEDGGYAHLLDRETAAMGCMAVTAACLLMMFLSKRISFPFLVSLFSLILPIFFSIAAKLPG